MRSFFKALKWCLIGFVVLVVGLLTPIIYNELACQGPDVTSTYKPIITDVKFQRHEANSYLTYPEWHIVYAYEGMANTLRGGDEYQFDYISSIEGFWSATCKLSRMARQHGGADFDTRSTNYVIGASFTLELGMKALYEELLGRLFATLRGPNKTPQDQVAANMAENYAAFLQQTPWYEYPFADEVTKLWAAHLDAPLRGWERRLALGGEWKAKIAYANGIKSLVGATTGDADLEIRSVVKDISPEALATIKDVQILSTTPQGTIINTPRYGAYTNILKEIAAKGGNIVEIAGNENIFVTAIKLNGSDFAPPPETSIIGEIARDGYDDHRLLLSVPIIKLADLIRKLETGPVKLEHIYDY